MRRTDREITDHSQLRWILERGVYCTLSLLDGDSPYSLPLNYGFEERGGVFFLYFHCAKEGKKLDLIRRKPNAAFSVVCDPQVPSADKPCDYTCFYESVCGKGTIRFLEGAEADSALRCVVAHYAPEKTALVPGGASSSVCVLALEVEELTGKGHR